MGQRPPDLAQVFKEINLGFTGNFYHALLCLWFRLHFPTNFTPGIKTAVPEHLCLTTLITPISSRKGFQPAALQTLCWFPSTLSRQLESNSWPEGNSSKRWSSWWHLPARNQVTPKTQIMIQPWIMGICSQNCSQPKLFPRSCRHRCWTGNWLGDGRNDETISAVQGDNVSAFEAAHQRNQKHFQCLMS